MSDQRQRARRLSEFIDSLLLPQRYEHRGSEFPAEDREFHELRALAQTLADITIVPRRRERSMFCSIRGGPMRRRAFLLSTVGVIALALGGQAVLRGQRTPKIRTLSEQEMFDMMQGSSQGHTYKLYLKNENVASWLDGKPDATAPDLICNLDPKTGDTQFGQGLGAYPMNADVVMVGIPNSPMWRTPKALEVLGPRHFGLEFDYRPLDEIQRGRPGFGTR